MAKSKEGKEKDFNNEDLYRFIWDALHHGDTMGKDGGEIEFPRVSYASATKSPTFDEMRNHIIAKALEDPSYIEAAMDAYNDFMGTEYPYTKFSPKKEDQRAVNIDAKDREAVDAYSNRIAQALGFADNDKKAGALSELIGKYYKDENGKFVKGDKRHAGVAKLLVDKLKESGQSREDILKALDISGDLSDSEVVNYIIPYLERSRKASEYDNMPSALKVLGSLAFSQSAKDAKEGKNPSATSGVTDLMTLLALGKISKGSKLNPASFVGKTSLAVGTEGLSDLIHDAVDEEGKQYVYETGENMRSREGDWSDVASGSELAGRVAELAPSLVLSLMLGSAGALGLSKGQKLLNRGIDKAKSKGEEIFGKIFGGKSDKEIAKLNRDLNKAKKKEEKAREAMYKAEEDYALKAPEAKTDAKLTKEAEKYAGVEGRAAARIALDKAREAHGLTLEEIRKIEEALASGKELPDNIKGKLGELLLSGGRKAATGLDVLGLRMYDPNADINFMNKGRGAAMNFRN